MTAQKQEKTSLTAETRTVVGKKLKTLRSEGKMPANIFGKDIASTSISVDARDFMKAFRKVGETQVLYVDLDKKEIPVLVVNLHVHPVSGTVLHADFKKIDLKKKIEAHVPVKLTGESEAVEQRKGDLHTVTDEILVEALPSDMPQEIEVDISILKEVDDEITVAQLKAGTGYTFLTEPATVIAKIAEHKEESIEPETAPEGKAAVEGEEAAAEDGAAETPAEDAAAEAPAEE